MPESKYYDKYYGNNLLTACNGSECLSHGLSETAGWYSDFGSWMNETYSWFTRSGHYYDAYPAGIFFIYALTGGLDSNYNRSFRLTLVSNS